MSKISTRWFLGMAVGGAIALGANSAIAQITPDATLPNNSNVTVNGKTFNIDGGTTAGRNLFHSFKEFSVPTGGTASFNNAADIQNIFSRVTGGSISNIDGIIKALGTANLFLINPNGIIFGQNATLNVGGSFVGTTANSLKFRDGTEFSAANPQTTPLLTVSVPIGLQFGLNPGEIVNRSQASQNGAMNNNADSPDPVGLQVLDGKTLALVGGDIINSNGNLIAPAGRIEIGSVGSNQLVNIDLKQGLKLGYEGVTNFGDIKLSGEAKVQTIGDGGGTIALAGRNINLSEASLSAITVGNQNGGEISIFGDSIVLNNSALGSMSFFGSGNSGQITLNANNITMEKSSISSSTGFNVKGKGGDINIKVNGLLDIKDTTINSDTQGMGDAGNINISATSFLLNNPNKAISSATFSAGNAGRIKIEVNGEFIANPAGGIGTNTNGTGNAGTINISANSFQLKDGEVSSSSAGENTTGNAGNIDIKVANLFTINNTSVVTNSNSSGKAGDLKIQASTLVLEGLLNVNSTGIGDAGDLNIVADTIKINYEPNGIFATTNFGNGGNLTLNVAKLLLLDNGSRISASAGTNQNGGGKGGNIIINAPNGLIVGVPDKNNDITANAYTGSGGKVEINALGIFGIAPLSRKDLERLRPTDLDPSQLLTNDITAISQQNPSLSGQVNINIFSPDPSQGLVKLSTILVNTPRLVAPGCAAFDTGGSSFTVTGRGGLPPSPDEPLTNDVIWTDARIPTTTSQQHSSNKPSAKPHSKPKAEPIVIAPAIGWVFNGNGEVTLISSTHNANSLGTTPATCPVQR